MSRVYNHSLAHVPFLQKGRKKTENKRKDWPRIKKKKGMT